MRFFYALTNCEGIINDMEEQDKAKLISTLIKKERNHKLIMRLFNGIFKRIMRYEIVNSELLPQENGSILVFNHKDYWDVPLLFSVFNTKPIRVLSKIELQKETVGKILEFMGAAVYVDRSDEQSRKSSMNVLIELVTKERNVALAPEGTRNKTNSLLLPFIGYGAVRIAQITGRPIVPFAISRYKEGRRRLVRICNPLFVAPHDNLDDANNKLYERMYAALLQNNEVINEHRD
jgi:1-acyl-sn-glycerol-3-phosphate acyltransferase